MHMDSRYMYAAYTQGDRDDGRVDARVDGDGGRKTYYTSAHILCHYANDVNKSSSSMLCRMPQPQPPQPELAHFVNTTSPALTPPITLLHV